MAHWNKWLQRSALLLIPVVLAGCSSIKIQVEDGGYKPTTGSSANIVDEIETTAPYIEQVTQEVEIIYLSEDLPGVIVDGPADVYDEPEGNITGSIQTGEAVVATARMGGWYKIQQGWILSTHFSKTSEIKVDEEGTVGYINAGEVNVRSGPGTENNKVGVAKRNELLVITEVKEDENKLQWGKFDRGWVCLDYVSDDLWNKTALVTQDKVTVMGQAGNGGVVTELTYGTWVTIRATQVVKGVAWAQIGDGWVDLSETALNTFDSGKLHGVWRGYENYNSWTFHTDGTFAFVEEDYEMVNKTLKPKGDFTSYEGAFIFDGKDLHLYYITINGQKTTASMRKVVMSAAMNGSDWIFNNETKNPLTKDLTPEKIYEEKYAPKSDPAAVEWVSGSWLYFTHYTANEDGTCTAKGNVITYKTDGTFAIQSCSFKTEMNEEEQLVWTATLGGQNSGTFIYDGSSMIMSATGTATISFPKSDSDTIGVSGLQQLGDHDGVQPQTLYKVSGNDPYVLCAIAKTIFEQENGG